MALELYDIKQYIINGNQYSSNHVDSTLPNQYFIVPARDYILSRSQKEKLIIVNESHGQPIHRVFVTSLLEQLYKNGFRYFAVETIAQDSSAVYLLNKNKFPIISSGYYSKEPQYGNLIREALKLGFQIVAYECTNCEYPAREREQARNLKRVFDKDPNAKMLVYCGYGHACEAIYKDTLMAGHIKYMTGINPFTMDQVSLTEHSQSNFESPYYAQFRSPVPSVLIKKTDSADIFTTNEDGVYDAEVFHPRTNYVKGRPSWIMLPGRNYVSVNKNANIDVRIDFPFVIQAFSAEEDPSRAVPVDCIEVQNKDQDVALILNPGKYLLRLYNETQKQEINFSVK
jgi:hypothetical protein